MVEAISLLNVVTEESLDMDMLTTPFFILDSCIWGQIEAVHNSTTYFGQIGVTITNTVLGTRTVDIIGWVIANSEEEMDERKNYLNHFVNPLQEIELTYKDYSITFKPNSTVKYSQTKNENNEIMTKFQISGTAEDPLFKDAKTNIAKAFEIKPLFHFPLIIPDGVGIPMGVKELNPNITVKNKGDVTTGMTIILNAKGRVVNPVITSANNQKSFKLEATLVENQKVVITTDIGNRNIKSYYGDNVEDYYGKKDFDSDWLQAYVGENVFVISADEDTESNLVVEIEFTNKYLEVEKCY